MSLRFDWLAVDSHDPESLSRFWAQVLDYEVEYDSATDPDGDDSEREIAIKPKAGGSGIQLLFLEVHDPKTMKNRLHLDLRPDDQEAEVKRVEALGATRVDIGQGDVTWVVLADPEGNEFCILRASSPSDDQ